MLCAVCVWRAKNKVYRLQFGEKFVKQKKEKRRQVEVMFEWVFIDFSPLPAVIVIRVGEIKPAFLRKKSFQKKAVLQSRV